MLNIILHVIIVLEMIVVNISLVYIYSERKYSKKTTLFWLILTTVALITVFYRIIKNIPGFGNGNGLFILFGSFYLIPIKILFKQSFKKGMIILYTSWVYTALGFTLAVQFARLFSQESFVIIVISFQTIYYLIGVLLFLKHLSKRFEKIINNITEKVATRYMITTVLMYLSLIMINYTFVIENTRLISIMKLVCFIVLGISYTFSFYFIFGLVNTTKDNIELKKLTYFDSITNVPNRNYLIDEFKRYKDSYGSFTLAFLDLDNFKNINDTYGHGEGDRYLKLFSNSVQDYFQNHAKIYRLHGDEFILLSNENEKVLKVLVEECQKIICSKFTTCDFLGFSYGIVTVNDKDNDLVDVLKSADSYLYINKKKKLN